MSSGSHWELGWLRKIRILEDSKRIIPPSLPLLQGALPAAEPAYGCTAGLHLCCSTGPQPRRCLDGPGHPLRILRPAAWRYQVLHQCYTQQGLPQHCCTHTTHQTAAGRAGIRRVIPLSQPCLLDVVEYFGVCILKCCVYCQSNQLFKCRLCFCHFDFWPLRYE